MGMRKGISTALMSQWFYDGSLLVDSQAGRRMQTGNSIVQSCLKTRQALTARAPASHTGNWLSAKEMAQHETEFFIPNMQTHKLPLPSSSSSLPLLFLPSSPLREVLITTAAAPHPVSIHTQPSKPIRGLIAYNCVCVILCVWEKVSFR